MEQISYEMLISFEGPAGAYESTQRANDKETLITKGRYVIDHNEEARRFHIWKRTDRNGRVSYHGCHSETSWRKATA